MKTYEVVLTIRAECEDDARELIDGYTGEETDVNILSMLEVKDEHELSEEEVEALEQDIKKHLSDKMEEGGKGEDD